MRDFNDAVRRRLARHDGAPPLPRDVTEEIAQHIADLHRAALLEGHSDEEADRIAEREIARIDHVAESIVRRRQQRAAGGSGETTRLTTGLSRDLSHAWRLIQTKRAYSAVTLTTLAVGIGACAAVFSLFHSLLLGPLPYPQPDRLVLLWETVGAARSPSIVSAPNYVDWRAGTRSFDALGIWEQMTFNVSATAEPEQVAGLRASASLFQVLGVPPAIGRVFTESEDTPGHAVAVIADAVWRVHFAADPRVLDKSVVLNGQRHQVIGVMPPGFEFPRRGTGIWTPIAFTRLDQQRRAHSFNVAGRLKDDVTFEQARDEVEALGLVLRDRYEENQNEGATVERMSEFGLLNTRRILVALSGAAALVLLIACVNVASLQLAFGLSRRREFVTRLALGARYAHLARQVFVEGLLISLLGCAGGLVIAMLVTRGVDSILSPGFRTLPFRGAVPVVIDHRVLLFAVIVSAASAVLFAFAPLFGLRSRALQPMLRAGDRGASRFASGTRRVLVAIEIALAIVVLAGAGLMIRSLSTLLQVRPGFDPSNVVVMQVSLPQADTFGPPEREQFCGDLAREMMAVPGIVRVSAVSHLPLAGASAGRGFRIEGRPEPPPNEQPSTAYRMVCPEYFATLGIPIIQGRDFTLQDRRAGESVVIVNRAFADRYWPDGGALGQRVKIGNLQSSNPWMTIVGITDNVRHFGLDSAPTVEMFRPYTQAAWPVMTIVVKTVGTPMTWERPVREALRRVELNLPAANARSMDEVLSRSVAWRQTPIRLLMGFAVVGLLLAAVGIYGVLAYYVSQRTRELGVRVALGASKGGLTGLVLGQSIAPLAAGLVLGIGGSIVAGRLLSELLYEVKPSDPIVLGTIALLITLVSLASSWLPARRAAMVDPLVALREE